MITIIFCGDYKYCPYLKRYTERLDRLGKAYQVLLWNRGGFKLDLPDNYFCYDLQSPEDQGMARKAVDFYKFRRWILRHLKKYPADALIFLTTLVGVLLADKVKKYPYIFDVRDSCYEQYGLFRRAEKRVVDNSVFTCISSPGFRAFLPEHDYVPCHNLSRTELPQKPPHRQMNDPIRIVWNGTVRYFDFQKYYLDAFKNDSRFRLVYHGLGTDLQMYQDYCRENDIRNVEFTGGYDNRDKPKLLQDADVLNNCYGGQWADTLRYAVSNRFYDGLIYGIPQMVEPGGVKESLIGTGCAGIALAPGPDTPDRLYEYLQNLDRDRFSQDCAELLSGILQEDQQFTDRIDDFITEYGG